MKSPVRLLVPLIAVLTATACAGAPPIPIKFEFSEIRISRDHHHRNHDYRSHRPERHASCGCSCRSGDAIKLIAGSQRGKRTRPSGWHPREWYERRGYDLENYAHKHRDGTVHRGSRLGRRH